MKKVFDVIDLVNEIANRTNLDKDDICDGLFYSFNFVPEKEKEVLVHMYFLKKPVDELLNFMNYADESEIMDLRNKGVEYVIDRLVKINTDYDEDETDSE
jgi:hypothetical protein